jgi:hypothetical protein
MSNHTQKKKRKKRKKLNKETKEKIETYVKEGWRPGLVLAKGYYNYINLGYTNTPLFDHGCV